MLFSRVGGRRLPPALLAALGLLVFLGIWEAVPKLGLAQETLLPAPSDIPPAFLSELESGAWAHYVSLSLGHYLLGYLCGAGFGGALGVLTGMHRPLEEFLAWVVRLLRPIPNLAWAPFAILWFGVGQGNAVFLISIGVFWIAFFAAQGSVRAVDQRPDRSRGSIRLHERARTAVQGAAAGGHAGNFSSAFARRLGRPGWRWSPPN